MRNRRKISLIMVQWMVALVLTAVLVVPAFADSIVHAPEFVAGGITEGEYKARVTGTRIESEQDGAGLEQEEELNDDISIETPSAPEAFILDGRDCFFANGTPITILPSDEADWSEISVDVALSSPFFGWIFALGPHVRIISPQNAVKQFANELDVLSEMYRK